MTPSQRGRGRPQSKTSWGHSPPAPWVVCCPPFRVLSRPSDPSPMLQLWGKRHGRISSPEGTADHLPSVHAHFLCILSLLILFAFSSSTAAAAEPLQFGGTPSE